MLALNSPHALLFCPYSWSICARGALVSVDLMECCVLPSRFHSSAPTALYSPPLQGSLDTVQPRMDMLL